MNPAAFFRNAVTALLFALPCARAAEPAFTVHVDTSEAPECAAFAGKSKALCEAWYPKISEILFGKDHPLPSKDIWLTFKPMKGVGETRGNRIDISAEWVTKKAPDDYGMVIHELTHVVQDYKGRGVGWLTEGIADWIRDRHFEPGKRVVRLTPKSSYLSGYNTAAAFLMALEERTKDTELVRKLNMASHDGTYTDALFEKLCGKPLPELWSEFAEAHGQPAKQ
jgi:hypothetical protein